MVSSDNTSALTILHVIGSLDLGGAESLLYRIATSPSSCQHRIISLGPPGWYSDRLSACGICVEHLDMISFSGAVSSLFRLRRLIQNSDADIIHCWMYRSNIIAGLMAYAGSIPVVWSVHAASITTLSIAGKISAYLNGILAGIIPSFIINCSNKSSEIHAKIGFSRSLGRVVHNGYSQLDYFPNNVQREFVRNSIGVDGNVFLVGSITRWHSEKNIPGLLDAVRSAHDNGVPLHCLLIGNGLDVSNTDLQRLILMKGCEKLVSLLGKRDDVPNLARALDLHLLPSFTEAFPNVVAEAMLSGTPSVVTDVGDCRFMIGENGWIAPPYDDAAFSDAIVQAYTIWLDNSFEWEKIRDAARARVINNFSFNDMMRQYEEIWYCLAKKSKSAI